MNAMSRVKAHIHRTQVPTTTPARPHVQHIPRPKYPNNPVCEKNYRKMMREIAQIKPGDYEEIKIKVKNWEELGKLMKENKSYY